MTSGFAPLAPRKRALIAGAALLLTAGAVGSVLTLAEHYDLEFLQLARSAPAATSLHAHEAAGHAPSGALHPAGTVSPA